MKRLLFAIALASAATLHGAEAKDIKLKAKPTRRTRLTTRSASRFASISLSMASPICQTKCRRRSMSFGRAQAMTVSQ